ncbi:hypothetical protein [Streptacidiphilus neutrinimicus]|uniref:hypothetical protein n=1 Tax=Streptacidiphilus neutrinimicus TaxID=105420 RepID=UPI0005A708E3|nr:hypothetical protein [Streptacidiphilus neutrinimicus]
MPWGPLAGLFLLVLALLAVLAGVTASGRLLRGAGKPGQHRAGPLLLLAGAAMIALGVWTW